MRQISTFYEVGPQDLQLIKDKSKCSFSLILAHSPPLLSRAGGPIGASLSLSLSAAVLDGPRCLVNSSLCSLHLSHSLHLHARRVAEKSQVMAGNQKPKKRFSFTALTWLLHFFPVQNHILPTSAIFFPLFFSYSANVYERLFWYQCQFQLYSDFKCINLGTRTHH